MSHIITDTGICINHSDVISYIKNAEASEIELQHISIAVNNSLGDKGFSIESLEDVFKVKLLQEAYRKYSIIQLENLFKL